MTYSLIGMVHLPALPGSPLSALSLDAIIDRAVQDAVTLESGGADAVIVENFNDVPFRPGQADAHTIAMMTRACLAVRRAVSIDIGVNVLRSDGPGAISIAAATGCRFIRVNVHNGVMITDQGLIAGRADETLRLRRMLDAEGIAIFADVLVKHAVPLGPVALEEAVADLIERGLAGAVVISGSVTGKAANPAEVESAAAVAKDVPLYVGSGITADNVTSFVPPAAGVIAGTWLKFDGNVLNPVDEKRVSKLAYVLSQAESIR